MLSTKLSLAFSVVLSIITESVALSTPPSGAITIGGSSGKYKTITAGLADTSSSVYFIYAVRWHSSFVAMYEARLLTTPIVTFPTLPGNLLGTSVYYSGKHQDLRADIYGQFIHWKP